MLVVVCRPGEAPILEQSNLSLPALQSLVGGYLEGIRLDKTTDLLCNEEALLHPNPTPNRLLPDGRILHGTFVVVGRENNDTVGLSEADANWWLAEITRWSMAVEAPATLN